MPERPATTTRAVNVPALRPVRPRPVPRRRRPLRVRNGAVRALVLAALLATPLAVGASGSNGPVHVATLHATGPAGPLPPSAIASGPVGRVALLRGWTLALDPTNSGVRRGWMSGRFDGIATSIPSVGNPAPITGHGGVLSYAGSIGWYRTSFDLPQSGTYSLRFESVNHLASVWLDGRRLGGHMGTYLPFELRFNAVAGPHTLVVRADWRSPTRQSIEGFHRTWFNFGGINREVSLRLLGPSELISPTLTTRLVGSGGDRHAIVEVHVQLHNNAAPRQIALGGTLVHGNQSVELKFAPVTVRHGASTGLRATATVSSPALWSPSSPSLYDFDLLVSGESEYRARVGLREIRARGGHLYLNGNVIALRGASISEDARGRGDALRPRDQDQLVADLRAIGANATRSQHPLDVGLLERFDAAGMMVWQGVGPVDPPGDWSARTATLRHRAEQRVRMTQRQDQLHPSVIVWSLVNEIAGNGHAGGEAQYMEHMSRVLHSVDPGRLVAVDVWGNHPPSVAGAPYRGLDAVGITDYEGWYSDTLQPPAVVGSRMVSHATAISRTFAGKVIVISEFGAEANSANPSSSPGGYDFQARLLALHIRTYRRIPTLSGMLVWNLRDFAVPPSFAGGSIRHQVPGIQLVKGINQKGLFSYDNGPKPAVRSVRQNFLARG